MNRIKPSDVVNYFFPIRCLICEHINNQKNSLCVSCSSKIKYSFCEKSLAKNDLIDLFQGRVPFQQAFYFFQADEDGVSKKIIHEIKYNANFRLMEKLGQTIKDRIQSQLKFDYILPVPLNKKKQKSRGYNQSELIAKSIFGEEKIVNDLIIRIEDTKTQTGFGKFQRWDNIKDAFEINEEAVHRIGKDKLILIVDDVVTTGATIEAILSVLKSKYPEFKFSVLTLMKA